MLATSFAAFSAEIMGWDRVGWLPIIPDQFCHSAAVFNGGVGSTIASIGDMEVTMKRFLSASAIGIVFSVIVAATIQAYDEPKSACTRASSPSCCKNSAGCPTTVAADAKQCDIVLGGVRPRIVIEEEEESLLGINLDSSESPCCHESTECPVLKAAQQAKSAAKRTNKKPRAVAIRVHFDFSGESSAVNCTSQCNCCEGDIRAVISTDACAAKCTRNASKCCTDSAGVSGCCAEGTKAHTSCDTSENVTHHGKVRDGEAAKVLLEVLDRIGPSVLEGTAFDNESCPAKCATGHGEIPRSIRQQLVEYVHMLEAEDACQGEDCVDQCEEETMVPIGHTVAVDPPCPPCPVNPYTLPMPGPHAIQPQAYGPPTAYYAPYAATGIPCPMAQRDTAVCVLRTQPRRWSGQRPSWNGTTFTTRQT